MTLLVLGGTQEGKQIAQQLCSAGQAVIYSIAGLVRQPEMPCPVISGGFSQYGGLANYLQHNAISAIIDATHPYATTMTATAIRTVQSLHHQASSSQTIGYWRIQRPVWQPQAEDHWIECQSWDDVCQQLDDHSQIFLSCGQLSSTELAQLPATAPCLYRTAVNLNDALPDQVEWLAGIGPFRYDHELALLKNAQINVLVTKNSGGSATAAKLLAARQLGIRVLMLARPQLDIMQCLSDEPLTDQQLNGWLHKGQPLLRCVTHVERCGREVLAVYGE